MDSDLTIPERAAKAQTEAGLQLLRDIAIDRILDPPRTYPPFVRQHFKPQGDPEKQADDPVFRARGGLTGTEPE